MQIKNNRWLHSQHKEIHFFYHKTKRYQDTSVLPLHCSILSKYLTLSLLSYLQSQLLIFLILFLEVLHWIHLYWYRIYYCISDKTPSQKKSLSNTISFLNSHQDPWVNLVLYHLHINLNFCTLKTEYTCEWRHGFA